MSETTDERVLEIVRALISQTKQGRISWTPTDDQEAFLYSSRSSSIIVDTNRRKLPQPYWIRILNERGAEVGRLHAAGGDAARPDLAELHELARRSALRIDEVLDNVLRDLQDPPPF